MEVHPSLHPIKGAHAFPQISKLKFEKLKVNETSALKPPIPADKVALGF